MTDFHIEVTQGDDNVAVVEFQRGKHNYFTADLVGALVETLRELGSGRTRAVVLCSAGPHFCAGADFGDAEDRLGALDRLYDGAVGLVSQPLPIVAAIQGAAVGGGMGVAMTADFRVADPSTRFMPNFARIGLHHGFGLSVTLPAVVGTQRALEYLYSGKTIAGSEALSAGLCDRLSEAGELRQMAYSLALSLADSAPLALRAIRRTLRYDVVRRMQAAVVGERREQESLFVTDDFAEGVSAHREHRRPTFSGR